MGRRMYRAVPLPCRCRAAYSFPVVAAATDCLLLAALCPLPTAFRSALRFLLPTSVDPSFSRATTCEPLLSRPPLARPACVSSAQPILRGAVWPGSSCHLVNSPYRKVEVEAVDRLDTREGPALGLVNCVAHVFACVRVSFV